MSKSKNLILGLGILATQGCDSNTSSQPEAKKYIAEIATQNIVSKHEQISAGLQKTVHENFVLYKNKVGYPHDTVYAYRDYVPESKLAGEGSFTIAMGKPQTIIINTLAHDSDVSDYVVAHELTHTRKDSITRSLNFMLNDGNRITGISGLTLDLQTPTGEIIKFGIAEEAAAEFIAYKTVGPKPFTDPRYYALQCFMRILEENKIISVQTLTRAIDNDDVNYLKGQLDMKEDTRGDNRCRLFSSVYYLGKNDSGGHEKDPKIIEQKVRDFVHKTMKF